MPPRIGMILPQEEQNRQNQLESNESLENPLGKIVCPILTS